MNDTDFGGRNIKVNIALGKKENSRPRENRYNNDRRGGFGGRDRY